MERYSALMFLTVCSSSLEEREREREESFKTSIWVGNGNELL